jgi:esterase
MLAQHIEIAGVRQFLLKSFAKAGHGWGGVSTSRPLSATTPTSWAGLTMSRFEGPSSSSRGIPTTCSPKHTETVMAQFPAAKARVIAGRSLAARGKAGFVQQTGCGFPVDRRLTVSNLCDIVRPS